MILNSVQYKNWTAFNFIASDTSMGRRSDHTRAELRELLVSEGHGLLEEVGYARFSGREVAKRAGYAVGTIYNVFGSLDLLLLAINTRTFEQWAAYLRERLAEAGEDRIGMLVHAYFEFAQARRNLWMSIYDHRMPPDVSIPEADMASRAELTRIVDEEVGRFLGEVPGLDLPRYTRSLIATVHGHCSFALTGTFEILGETDPVESALARVRESLAQVAQG